MSKFFQNSDLDSKKAESIVSNTLNNCDDGELYLENSKSETILLDDNKIKNSSYSSDLGYGFRAITGEVVAYSHSNDISKDSLEKSSQNLNDTLKSKRGILQLLAPKQSKVVRLLGGSSGKEVDKREECKKLGFPWIVLDGEEEMPLVLPDCVYYLELILIGDLIDCGSHDVALCKVNSMLIRDEAKEDEIQQLPYLNTASLREMGLITSAGRVADLDE